MKIAGLDIGTTGCKCTVFDELGTCLDLAYRDYPVRRDVGGHEIDLSTVMKAVYIVILNMAAKFPDIRGIGVTSFGETFIMTDEAGNPLHLAMLYTDPRGYQECEDLAERLGEKKIARITGLRPHEMYSISKIMWIKKNRPEIYAATEHIFLMEDYVVYHLTGKAQIDYSLASRTMAFDIHSLSWSREIFETAGVDMGMMSVPVPAGSRVGTLSEAAVHKTGLAAGTEVVSVGHDQIAAAAGAGAFDSSVAVDGAGTVQCLTPIYDELPAVDVMYDGHFSVVPYVIPGKYAAYAFSYTGGALLQWCAETLAKKEQVTAAAEGITVNEYLEREYWHTTRTAGPGSLLVLPHFSGAATPYMDTGSKGAVIGLTTATTTADIYRGCMEGVVYEMYLNMQALKESGIRFTRIHATGGGARSGEWMQMKADMLNMPITVMETIDAGTVGSAMLTGIALGIFDNLDEAAKHMVKKVKIYEPHQEMHEKYAAVYENYVQLYDAVRSFVSSLGNS